MVQTTERYSFLKTQTDSDTGKSWKRRKILKSEWLFALKIKQLLFTDRPWSKILVPADSGISGNAPNYDIITTATYNCNILIDRDFE